MSPSETIRLSAEGLRVTARVAQGYTGSLDYKVPRALRVHLHSAESSRVQQSQEQQLIQ
jgi:hypothetical protein